MENTYLILTSLLMIPLAIYMFFSMVLIKHDFNHKNAWKCLGISSTLLALVSIPRTIVMMQMGKDYIVFFWILTAYWLYQSVLAVSVLIEE